MVDGLLPGLPGLPGITNLLLIINWTREMLNSHGEKQKPFVQTFPKIKILLITRNGTPFLRQPCMAKYDGPY